MWSSESCSCLANNWTADYRINTLKEKLPENLKHKGEYRSKLGYNNELSKQIGLDFTDYLGKSQWNLQAEESLPEFLGERM